MKKLLTLTVLSAFVIASCQKEEAPQPEKQTFKTVSEKKDTGGWD